ncbi:MULTISPECIES: LuxR family transcriptional regulator [unclassified Acinetobacter]|uniref:LuxR family transcriptional regulator n=1 Tax=unclassified Acinetobacter TaxID=196816 RepID=UPI0018ED55A3|nr:MULTISPECIES: LuxR family transcriptional regulator [unclassified Acinetobacter]MBJ6352981.1 LuxR family transcriptional regulator [Acinetobacter sp. c1]MBM0958600.1 LuxR family transcriptional regulator [Acinetobacter sp. C13]
MDIYDLIDITKENFEKAVTKEEFIQICDYFFNSIKIDYFMICICDTTSLVKPQTIIIDNFPKLWCKIYFERNFQKCDPITDYCFSNAKPIFWHELLKLPKYQEPRYKTMFTVAQQFNLNSGVSIPFTTAKGDMGMISLVSKLDIKNSEKILTQSIPFGMLLACHLSDCIYSSNLIKSNKLNTNISKLTSREHDCLLWASEGKTSWEISQILGITERTVLFHMNNVVKKIGAKNRQHAVAQGIVRKVILPNFMDHSQ